MGKMIYNERDGYSYISDNGIVYDLLEGMSFHGKNKVDEPSTSEILFIMLQYDIELFETLNITDGQEFVCWFYGAFVEPNSEWFLYTLAIETAKYEEKHPEIIEYYKNKQEVNKRHYRNVTFRQTIEKTVRVYDDDKEDGEDPRVAINKQISCLCDDPDPLYIEKNFDKYTVDAVFIGDLCEEDSNGNSK